MHQLTFANNIILFSLVPHCTHKLQPLDVGVFGPFQNAWVKYCQEWAIENNPVTRDNVVQRYMEVRQSYVTDKTICAAFKHSGLYPINLAVFSEADFAPSHKFSTQATVPASYPCVVPSSLISAEETDIESDPEDSDYITDDEPHSIPSGTTIPEESDPFTVMVDAQQESHCPITKQLFQTLSNSLTTPIPPPQENSLLHTQLYAAKAQRDTFQATNSMYEAHCQAEWEKNDQVAQAKMAAQEVKQQQKADALQAQEKLRVQNADKKIFDRPLGRYMCKDDIQDIAAAFDLSWKTGIIADIFGRVKAHLDTNPQLQSNPRFAKLFSKGHGNKQQLIQSVPQFIEGSSQSIPSGPANLIQNMSPEQEEQEEQEGSGEETEEDEEDLYLANIDPSLR
ncbi:hypothetical protein M422DRAFT_243617 [Sphaerobolus stellatus SS14]|nr:hypothetical protein M422DRAFT_243617 [Sphaerobolus stellatus SS14]